MRPSVFSLLSLTLPGFVHACDGDGHSHARRSAGTGPPPPIQLTPPTRQLDWGDINIIHTTDSHGWLLGHQKTSFPEPNYSADLGDFASFVSHTREAADKRGVDLLLVDSGDLHDGTGLTDEIPPGGVNGHDAIQFFKELNYDVMSIGNHELYNYSVTLDMYRNFTPALNGRYLSSNAYLTVPELGSVPVGNRSVTFRTKQNRTITALGILYDFTGNDRNGTTVHTVEDMVNEPWFKDAIREEPDVFLLAGHMPFAPPFDSWQTVVDAIRKGAKHENTPILILGGHTHIRDCVQLDDRSMSLQSGRYMDTVGWLSAKLDKKGSTDPIQFSRRYLDTNRLTYEFHTNTTEDNFDTPLGLRVSRGLRGLNADLDLSDRFGTAPRDYFLDAAPFPSSHSVYSLFINEVIPTALQQNNPNASDPARFIINNGSLRFDLYAGPFTRDDQWTISLYGDTFRYLKNIPLNVTEATVDYLNSPPINQTSSLLSTTGMGLAKGRRWHHDLMEVDGVYRRWLTGMDRLGGIERRKTLEDRTVGYVTEDSCMKWGPGDDTLHGPPQSYNIPNYIASDPPSGVPSDSPVDFVFLDFIQDRVLDALNRVQTQKYSANDTQRYSNVLTNAVFGMYAQQEWN